MHDYLRAVGFSKIQHKRDLARILDMVMGCPEKDYAVNMGDSFVLGEKSREFIPGGGITLRGEIDDSGMFSYDYFFPHYNGRYNSLTEDISFEKISEREEYDGLCDIVNLGVSLIFHMNRLSDYAAYMKDKRKNHASIRLSALSVSGKVILPVYRSEAQKMQSRRETDMRNGMISAARQGDQEALENLTIDDIDLYTEISKRIKHEDVLSIVESSFMPYGIACDQYAVIGEILACDQAYNQYTGEKIYMLLVECNDLQIDLCINEQDLLGVPSEGMRFRGNIWLQGSMDEE